MRSPRSRPRWSRPRPRTAPSVCRACRRERPAGRRRPSGRARTRHREGSSAADPSRPRRGRCRHRLRHGTRRAAARGPPARGPPRPRCGRRRPARPPARRRSRACGDSSLLLAKRRELPRGIELRELLEAADRPPIDEDLRHRPASSSTHDVRPHRRVVADVELLERNAPLREQTLGPYAIRTHRRRVYLHSSHSPKLDAVPRPCKHARVDRPQGRRYRPAMADRPPVDSFVRLVEIMARLRSPGGCPWDREQSPESLRPYVIEEAYEVVEAIERGDPDALRDELGDLLLQVVFQAQLAAEAGRFTIADVAAAIVDKLVRRHPHVFGDVEVRYADQAMRNSRRIYSAR